MHKQQSGTQKMTAATRHMVRASLLGAMLMLAGCGSGQAEGLVTPTAIPPLVFAGSVTQPAVVVVEAPTPVTSAQDATAAVPATALVQEAPVAPTLAAEGAAQAAVAVAESVITQPVTETTVISASPVVAAAALTSTGNMAAQPDVLEATIVATVTMAPGLVPEAAPIAPESPLATPTSLAESAPVSSTQALSVTTSNEDTEQSSTVTPGATVTATTALATEIPTEVATETPTDVATETPTEAPTDAPTETPTDVPTETPTVTPTVNPTEEPIATPTATPTRTATAQRTEESIEDLITPTPGEGTPIPEVTLDPTEVARSLSHEARVQQALRSATIGLPLAGAVPTIQLVNGTGVVTVTVVDGTPEALASTTSTATVHLLSPIALGDLDQDGASEVAVLAQLTTGARTLVYLLVLTGADEVELSAAEADSTPQPDAAESGLTQVARVMLGADLRIGVPQIANGVISLDIEQMQEGAPVCCPVRAERRHYSLQDGRLVLRGALRLELTELLDVTPEADAEAAPVQALGEVQDLALQADKDGVRTITISGETLPDTMPVYRLITNAGDRLTITVDARPGALVLTVAGEDEPVTWLPARNQATAFSAQFPTAQNVLFAVLATEAESPFTLTVTLESGDVGEAQGETTDSND